MGRGRIRIKPGKNRRLWAATYQQSIGNEINILSYEYYVLKTLFYL